MPLNGSFDSLQPIVTFQLAWRQVYSGCFVHSGKIDRTGNAVTMPEMMAIHCACKGNKNV
jgi:hypothetical protein